MLVCGLLFSLPFQVPTAWIIFTDMSHRRLCVPGLERAEVRLDCFSTDLANPTKLQLSTPPLVAKLIFRRSGLKFRAVSPHIPDSTWRSEDGSSGYWIVNNTPIIPKSESKWQNGRRVVGKNTKTRESHCLYLETTEETEVVLVTSRQ